MVIIVLTVLRKAFDEMNELKFSCLLAFEHTDIIEALDQTLDSFKDAADLPIIKLEILWALMNMAYCCSYEQEVELFLSKLLEAFNLKNLVIEAF